MSEFDDQSERTTAFLRRIRADHEERENHLDESMLLSYATGKLTDDDQTAAKRHLSCCSQCRSVVSTLGEFHARLSDPEWVASRRAELNENIRVISAIPHQQTTPRPYARVTRLIRSNGTVARAKYAIAICLCAICACFLVQYMTSIKKQIPPNPVATNVIPPHQPGVGNPQKAGPVLPEIRSGIAISPVTVAGPVASIVVMSPVGEVVTGKLSFVVTGLPDMDVTGAEVVLYPDIDNRLERGAHAMKRRSTSIVRSGNRLAFSIASLPPGEYRYDISLLVRGRDEGYPVQGEYRFTQANPQWNDLEWGMALARFGKWPEAEAHLSAFRSRQAEQGNGDGAEFTGRIIDDVHLKASRERRNQ